MPATFALAVDTVPVPPREPPLRARTAPNKGSMSAGSGSCDTNTYNEDSYTGLCAANGQPYDYPTAICVRNTFVDLKMPGRDHSLEEFLEERRIRSCPASWGPTLGKMDEEAPPASSRTTDCETASERSTIVSTPPPELALGYETDPDDTAIEVSPRGATNRYGSDRANFMPSSCTFRRTLSDYRNARPQPCFPTGSASLTQRSPYPPGPIAAAQYASSQQSSYGGYNNRCDNGLEANYEQEYANTYPSCYHNGGTVNAGGYPPLLNCYVMSPQEVQTPQPQILQLSTAIPSDMQPLLPQASPSSSAGPLQSQACEFEDMVVPTRGSLLHASGRCKPCAFMYTKGCDNGFECPFCHFCEPGEKKKRRKEKLEARRTMRDLRQVFSFRGQGRENGHGSVHA